MHLLIQPTHRMLLRYHPEVGHLFVPNLNARVPNELGGFYVRTNAQGFRSDAEFRPDQGDAPRILFFGDSFTAGDGVSNRERFSDLVGRETGAEVFNYGVPGTGTDQHLLIRERIANNVDCDLVVLGVYVENIERNVVSHRPAIDRASGKRVNVPKPYFRLDAAGQLELCNVPVPLERPDASPAGARSGSDRANGMIYRARSLYRRVSWLRGAVENSRMRMPGLWSRVYNYTGFDPYPGYRSSQTPDWRLMRAIIERFADSLGKTPLLIVPIPEFRYHYFEIKPRYQRLFEELAQGRANVHVADLTTPLCALSRADRRKLAFEHDPHLSPYGNQVVAQEIVRSIRDRKLLPAVNTIPAKPQSSTPRSCRDYVLGISCFYHNSAAALIGDGQIIAACEEERFTRKKNDRSFPRHAINYCLEEAGIQQSDLSAVVYYDNASLTFERLMHTELATADDGPESWLRVLPSWLQYKLHVPRLIRRSLEYHGPIYQEEHHRSHLASAFFASPFEEAAILTIDGVGEWATASIGVGRGKSVELLKEMRFPDSLGLLYSAFTQFTGFKVNSGEYKMMGLAPYGRPVYVDAIREHLVDVKDDGSIELNMECFAFLSQSTMTNSRFNDVFGGPPRHPDARITQREMDIARSIQVVTEDVILRMARHAASLTGMKRLCLSGGVALNCVANGRLLREGPFADLWIQPAAGDSGSALGAAFDVYYNRLGKKRVLRPNGRSPQGGSFLGPSYSEEEIRAFLDTHGYPYQRLKETERAAKIAELLGDGRVVGHFAGRVEFGPRSLGSRAILGDPRNAETQVNLNLKIKYRESFRPFAPTVLAERVADYFEIDRESPYMLLVADVSQGRRIPFRLDYEDEDLLRQVRQPRSDVPAITHVDYSARIQTIFRDDHPEYYDVVKAFETRTGCGVIVNTSFNVRGEPIICTPQDAYGCFMRTEMDALVLGPFLLLKSEQGEWHEAKGHIEEHDPDADSVRIESGSFTRGLKKVFEEDFVSLATRLNKEAGIAVRTRAASRPSMWIDRGSADLDRVFEIPAALSGLEEHSVDQMAQAITDQWIHRQAADALYPIVVRLLALCDASHDAAAEMPEEVVSESVYVMY